MKLLLSMLLVVLLLASTVSFAGYDEINFYEVNTKARILTMTDLGATIQWKWSKDTEYTGSDPTPTWIYDWGLVPLDAEILFTPLEDDSYLHLFKIFYNNYESPSFHSRYLGNTPILDQIKYKYECVMKFKVNPEPNLYDWKWRIFQAETHVYELIEGEYVYIRSQPAGFLELMEWYYPPTPIFEPPFGFGTL